MENFNRNGVAIACKVVQRRTKEREGYIHDSNAIYYDCQRIFEHTAVESITFKIFIAAPVNKPGEVTIHRNGEFQMHTI